MTTNRFFLNASFWMLLAVLAPAQLAYGQERETEIDRENLNPRPPDRHDSERRRFGKGQPVRPEPSHFAFHSGRSRISRREHHQAMGCRLRLADDRQPGKPEEFGPLPSGKTWDSFSVGVNGSIAFGEPAPGGRVGRSGFPGGGGVTVERFAELARAGQTVPSIPDRRSASSSDRVYPALAISGSSRVAWSSPGA